MVFCGLFASGEGEFVEGLLGVLGYLVLFDNFWCLDVFGGFLDRLTVDI